MKNFVVYKSSAGSGKTFTLVKEYLRLALFDEKKLNYNYKRILAVTFTNKAATEMKSRVVDALNKIAYDEALPYVGELLSNELGLSAKQLKSRARIVLSQILHHYSDFSIGTIDSFTHKIVKTFAHDLKLPVNFNIELDTESFYEKVISTLFSLVGEDEYVSKLLKEYVLEKAEDNAGWDPEKQIREFARLLQKENSEDYLNLLKKFEGHELEAFRKQFLDYANYYKSTIKKEAQKALDLIRNNNLTDGDFNYKSSGPQNFFKKCLDNSIDFETLQTGRFADAVKNNKWAAKDSINTEVIEKITPQLNAIGNTLIDFIAANYNYFSLCDALSRQMVPLMLLKKIEEIGLEKKTDERLVFISEFNHKIFEVIHHEPTPFIYERLGERYQHYLLDEFQDTSSLQWQNILPLLDNSLSNGWFNLIVGDGKQSIYRWRNANVQQFAALPVIENLNQNPLIEERALSLERNFEGKVLEMNYRSLKNIVNFNNTLFEFLSEGLLVNHYKTIYESQAQKIKNTSETGYITVNTGKEDADALDDFTCALIRDQINGALADGFSYKDICILSRKNYHGNVIAGYLVEQKIPVVSSDSLLLKNNFAINTILCYLRYMVNNQDMVSAAAVVNFIFKSGQITEQEFHVCLTRLSANTPLPEILKSYGIQLDTEEAGLANLLDNCISIINALGLNQHHYHYIRFFLDEVNEFLVTKNSNISAFFDWWEIRSNKASMIIPDNTNAVKIMTIHASKGLEFPVVIVPYCNWALYKSNESWVHVKHDKVNLPVAVIGLSEKAKDMGFELELETEKQEQVLDNLNMLYVAFTRAVERLHIITTASAGNKQKTVSDWIMNFLNTNYQTGAENFYEIGIRSKKQLDEHHKNPESFPLDALDFSTSKNVVRIKPAYLNNTGAVLEAKQQGIAMHWILSKIRTMADLDNALYAGQLEGVISKKDIAPLKIKLSQLIQHPQLAKGFQPGANCKLEAELVTQNGELLRPDRIIFTDTETLLIDYKTGKENNKAYFRQMVQYESALLNMGYPNVKKLLVYIDDLIIVAVN
ncbi:MAG: UvrD-helicase domain-containing protein [Bacteroidota bacterium]